MIRDDFHILGIGWNYQTVLCNYMNTYWYDDIWYGHTRSYAVKNKYITFFVARTDPFPLMALTVPSQKRWPSGNHGLAENVHVQEVSDLHMDIWVISHGYVRWPEGRVWFVLVHHFFGAKIGHSKNPSHHLIILHSIRYVRYVPQFWGYTFLDRFLVPFLMAPTLKADDVATLAFAQSEVRKHDPKRESPSSVTRKSSSSVTRTRFLGCDPVPRLWREVCFCVVGVALSAIDGLLVWHVLCLVTSTLHFCRFSSDLTSFFLVWWACRACVYRNMNVIIPPTPPHPTPPHPTPPHPPQ